RRPPRSALFPYTTLFRSVQVDFFVAGGVLEAQLVVAAAAGRGLGPPAALGLVLGQGEGRRVLGVVDTAGHQRPVGVALQKLDDDLHPDPRDELRAPAHARPALRAADPTRGLGGVARLLLPVELDLDAAVLVGVDLLARRAGHDRRLRAVLARPGGCERRPNHRVGRHAHERVRVALGARDGGARAGGRGLGSGVDDLEDQVLLLEIQPAVTADREAQPGP